ncbi:MAG: hypothetical protein ABI333_13255 [bacterium]
MRIVRLRLLGPLTALLLMGGPLSGCKGQRKRSASAIPDARAAIGSADAAAPPVRARRPGAMAALLAHVPRRAQWFLALGNPAGLARGAARLWRLLSAVPSLEQPLASVTRALARAVGRWPPDPAIWQRLGIDGDGGIVVADVPGEAGRPSGTLVVALARRPEQLLRRLTPQRPRGASSTHLSRLRATLSDGSVWWCGRRTAAVVCASRKQLAAPVRQPRSASPSVVGLFPSASLATADIVGGLRDSAAKPPSLLSARFTPQGLRARLQLRGPRGHWLRGWLGTRTAALRLRGNATAALRLQLSATRLQTLLAALPRSGLRPGTGGGVDLKRLALRCTGDVLLSIGPQGWSVLARRRGVSETVTVPTRARVGSTLSLWVLAPPGRLVIGSSVAAVQGAVTGSPHPAPVMFRQLFSRPTAAALLLPLVDPLELLPGASRAQLIAALAGLPEGERAFVGLVRALLTLMGEAGVTVERIPDGVLLRIALASPAAGPEAARRAFAQAWRSKWQGGGFFDRATLQRIRSSHPSTSAGRLAGVLTRFRLPAPLAQWITGGLVRLLAGLRGPELSCSAFAARLARCREAFGRQLEPLRWREVDVAMLRPDQKRQKSELLDRARRNGRTLGDRCDQVSGRLENATELQRCLTLDTCEKFAVCLQRAFVFSAPGALRRRP